MSIAHRSRHPARRLAARQRTYSWNCQTVAAADTGCARAFGGGGMTRALARTRNVTTFDFKYVRDYMKGIELRRIVGSGILALALVATGVQAQAGTGVQGDATTAPVEDEGGFDMGWIGLLGLAGLLGLRRKDEHHVTRVDTTTGTGTSSTRARV